MGRLHSKGKGISRSANPYKRSPPQWLKTSPLDVKKHVCKLAKKGLTPSQIGVILRDSSGIPAVKSVTGSKILRLLKKNGLAPEIPEDLYMLIKKACLSASTWSAIAQTKIQNFASSSSSRVSIASRVTIGPRASFMRLGSNSRSVGGAFIIVHVL